MANLNDQQIAMRKSLKRKPSMSNFREGGPEKEVDMILPDPGPNGNNNFSAFEINLKLAKEVTLTDKDQRATYYLGAICCLIPGISDDLQQAVRATSKKLRIIMIPSDAARNAIIVPQEIMNGPKGFAIFGYLAIMLYKNVTKSNFGEFTNKRLNALRSAAACIKKGDFSVFNDVEDAMYYRNSYGQNYKIRQAVLKAVLCGRNRNGPFGCVCMYVGKFLSWADMGGYHVVDEYLVLLDSAVLKAPELATEVSNWERANKAIKETEMPEYFRILHEDPRKCSIAKRSSFPMLIAVAEKIMKGEFGSSNKAGEETSEVDYYVDMHRKYPSAKLSADVKEAIDFLTGEFVEKLQSHFI